MVENEEFPEESVHADLDRHQIRALTKEEAWEIFDAQARERANMSGEEFLRAWDAGEFDDDPESVMFLAMLIPLAR